MHNIHIEYGIIPRNSIIYNDRLYCSIAHICHLTALARCGYKRLSLSFTLCVCVCIRLYCRPFVLVRSAVASFQYAWRQRRNTNCVYFLVACKPLACVRASIFDSVRCKSFRRLRSRMQCKNFKQKLNIKLFCITRRYYYSLFLSLIGAPVHSIYFPYFYFVFHFITNEIRAFAFVVRRSKIH